MRRKDRVEVHQTGSRQFRAAYCDARGKRHYLDGVYCSYRAAITAARYELEGTVMVPNQPPVRVIGSRSLL